MVHDLIYGRCPFCSLARYETQRHMIGCRLKVRLTRLSPFARPNVTKQDLMLTHLVWRTSVHIEDRYFIGEKIIHLKVQIARGIKKLENHVGEKGPSCVRGFYFMYYEKTKCSLNESWERMKQTPATKSSIQS